MPRSLPPTKKALYKGYSSKNYLKMGTFALTDVELIKEDILNHIFTRKGERVMMPNFGTIIPDLPFEPLDDETLDTLRREVQTVLQFEPRVSIISLAVTPNYDEHRVDVEALVRYVEYNIVGPINFNIIFEGV